MSTPTAKFRQLAERYTQAPIEFPQLKDITLAQWILESGRGHSQLAEKHNNFAGLKWRSEMEGYATKVRYNAHDGPDDYCAFSDVDAFIRGYWRFLDRSPYAGWRNRAMSDEEFIRYIGPTYTPKPSYSEDVLNLRPEARVLLDQTPSALTDLSRLAPGERDRPNREELETNAAGTGSLWIPFARRNEGGAMATRGTYRLGYPEGAIVHFTAGRDNPLSDISSARSNGYTYLVIAPNGTVYQNFPLNQWGYHAGDSSWPSLGGGVSRYLVGIEICASGKLRRIDANRFRTWYNEDLPAHLVRHVRTEANRQEGWYEKYTDAQEASLAVVLKWLRNNNPEVFSYDLVLGHDEVSPDRKNDPGGALSMTMPQYREWLKTNA